MSRLLGLQLAASDPHAIRAIESAMRTANGSVRAAAAALGVHEGSLSRWLRLPQLAKAATLRQGRESVGARSKTNAAKKTTETPKKRKAMGLVKGGGG